MSLMVLSYFPVTKKQESHRPKFDSCFSKHSNPNLRSKTAIRTSDTRYFVDSSIAAASMGIGPKDLLEDLETAGQQSRKKLSVQNHNNNGSVTDLLL